MFVLRPWGAVVLLLEDRRHRRRRRLVERNGEIQDIVAKRGDVQRALADELCARLKEGMLTTSNRSRCCCIVLFTCATRLTLSLSAQCSQGGRTDNFQKFGFRFFVLRCDCEYFALSFASSCKTKRCGAAGNACGCPPPVWTVRSLPRLRNARGPLGLT